MYKSIADNRVKINWTKGNKTGTIYTSEHRWPGRDTAKHTKDFYPGEVKT